MARVAALGEEDEEDRAAIWGIFGDKNATATVHPREAHKASLAPHSGPTVPMGVEAKEAV